MEAGENDETMNENSSVLHYDIESCCRQSTRLLLLLSLVPPLYLHQ